MKTHILKKPIITEKSLELIKNHNSYTFLVAKNATKGQIKKTVEELFDVNVININTVKVSGKRRRTGKLRRQVIHTDTKKAILKLKKGQKIDLFEVKE